MRSTMLMPVEWAVMRNADTAKLTALARQLPKSSYYYSGLRSSINLGCMEYSKSCSRLYDTL